jgi:DNA-binding MarR family transcriptional regulator
MNATAQARVLDPETRLDGADQESLRLWLRLFTCTKLIEREVDGVLKREFGSSLPRFDLLAQLDRSPGGLRMGELSARTLSSGGNITWLVAALERDGFVTRRVSREDKRAAQVKLTMAGRRQFSAMAKVHEALIAERFGALGVVDRRTLHSLLGTVKQRVTSVALVETT